MRAQSVSFFITVPKDKIVEKAHLTRVKKRKRVCFEIPLGEFFSFFSASVALFLSLSHLAPGLPWSVTLLHRGQGSTNWPLSLDLSVFFKILIFSVNFDSVFVQRTNAKNSKTLKLDR